MVRCPNCDYDNPSGMRYCGACGAQLSLQCPDCGFANPPEFGFCGRCGTRLADEAVSAAEPIPTQAGEVPSPEQPPLKGERRRVTVILADVKGSTALAERIDTEDWVEIMERVFQILSTEIYRYGGEIDQFRGDGLIAFFGLPASHEDDPERAVLAALAIQEAIKRYAAELAERDEIELLLRIGVNTGEVIAATVGDSRQHREDTAMGRAIALAARMETACEPGTVLVTESTYHQVYTLFDWQALGKIVAKGVSQPLSVYRPLAHRATTGKGRGVAGLSSPLVGRDAERRALQGAVERLESGVGGIVTVVGEAGIGKSRLVTEVRQTAVRGPQERREDSAVGRPTWVEGRCLSYATAVAYHMWLDMIRGLLEVAPDAPPSAVRDALQRWVRASCPDRYGDVYPYLARMLSLSLSEETEAVLDGLGAQGVQVSTFRALETLVERATWRRPLVLVCEDLHWADPTSLELLERLLPLVDRAPLLLLCILRPEREHGCWRIVETAARDYPHRHTDLRLGPLSAAESETLVVNLLRVEDLPGQLSDRVLDHAEGNPFYVEEILRSLIDRGVIAYDVTAGRWYATRDVSDIPIPETLHGALSARIDRLEQDTRRVLQLASVIGRIFTYLVLSAITDNPPLPAAADEGLGDRFLEERALDTGLVTHLVALERAQLIRERARVPEREYIFKHHLTQEAAYNGLLRRERYAYHRQVAQALERMYPDRLEEQLGLLALHWERAQEPAKAVSYLLRAGEQARTAYANEEAIAYFQRALALCEPPSAKPRGGSARDEGETSWRVEALKGLGQVYLGTGKIAEAEECLREAISLGHQMGLAARELVWLYHYLGEVLYWQGRWDERVRIGEEGLALLGDDTETVETALMNQTVAIGHFAKGNYEQCQDFTLRTARFLERLPYSEELRPAFSHMFALYRRTKDLEEGLRWTQVLEGQATRNHDLRALQTVHHNRGVASALAGDLRGAIAQYEQALRLSVRTGDLPYQDWCLAGMGVTYLWLGEVQKAYEYADRALKAAQAIGRKHNIALGNVIAGWVSVFRDDWEQAVLALQQAVRLLRETGPRWWEAWATYCLGQAHLARQDRAEAVERFEETLDLLDTERLRGYPFYAHIWNVVTLNHLAANVLSGLETAYEDTHAFRAWCDRRREQAVDGPFVQWYLEPAEPCGGLGPCVAGWDVDQALDPETESLTDEWSWQDPFGDCSFAVHNGLRIDVPNGRDLWIHNLSAPRMLRPASGDCAIQTLCLRPWDDKPAIGGLLLWRDRGNYLRLDVGPTGEREVLFRGCLAGRDILIGRGRLPSDGQAGHQERTLLRLERKGDRARAFCSADGAHWFSVGYVAFPAEDPVRVGVHAIGNIDRTVYHSPHPDGTSIRFESFQMWEEISR